MTYIDVALPVQRHRPTQRRSDARKKTKVRVQYAPIWPVYVDGKIISEYVGAFALEGWVIRHRPWLPVPLTNGSFCNAEYINNQIIGYLDFAALNQRKYRNQLNSIEKGIREMGRALGKALISLHRGTAKALTQAAGFISVQPWKGIRSFVLGGGLLQGRLGEIALAALEETVYKEGLNVYSAGEVNGSAESFGAGFLIQDSLPDSTESIDFLTLSVGGTSLKSFLGKVIPAEGRVENTSEKARVYKRPRCMHFIHKFISNGDLKFSGAEVNRIRAGIFNRLAALSGQSIGSQPFPPYLVVSTPGVLSGNFSQVDRRIEFGANIHYPMPPDNHHSLYPGREISTRLPNGTAIFVENDSVLNIHGLRKLPLVDDLLAAGEKIGGIYVGSGPGASILTPVK